ncbi:PREDICTED: uncharacterized protein LOC105547836 [Mandrillus leucophaeus]|uniref:uncharacterized protein LOC105547836 n=1 Tax=Mandrillus leucophaeus TaxID=9568 RepID=UPI0005F4049B|nr:PREDICTED: uncharacterized protein LOC105547836 [Mandrillus leucophaeus]
MAGSISVEIPKISAWKNPEGDFQRFSRAAARGRPALPNPERCAREPSPNLTAASWGVHSEDGVSFPQDPPRRGRGFGTPGAASSVRRRCCSSGTPGTAEEKVRKRLPVPAVSAAERARPRFPSGRLYPDLTLYKRPFVEARAGHPQRCPRCRLGMRACFWRETLVPGEEEERRDAVGLSGRREFGDWQAPQPEAEETGAPDHCSCFLLLLLLF